MGALLSLAACDGTPLPPPGTGGAAGEGGAGGDGGSGGTAATTSTTIPVIPWDGGPHIGFGYNGTPCGSEHGRIKQVKDGASGLTSTPIHVPVDGFITRVTVVHLVYAVQSTCSDMSGRRVFISEPTDGQIPQSPSIRETMTWTTGEVVDATDYFKKPPPPEVPDPPTAKAVMLARDLIEPMQVKAGDIVHVGSLLDAEPICVLTCDGTFGEPLPEEHSYCGAGETWAGCGPTTMFGDPPLAFVAWVDFAPE